MVSSIRFFGIHYLSFVCDSIKAKFYISTKACGKASYYFDLVRVGRLLQTQYSEK